MKKLNKVYIALITAAFVVTLLSVSGSWIFGLRIPFYSNLQYGYYVIIQNYFVCMGILLNERFSFWKYPDNFVAIFSGGAVVGYIASLATNVLTEFMWYMNPVSRIIGTFSNLDKFLSFLALHVLYMGWLQGGVVAFVFVTLKNRVRRNDVR